METQPGPVHSDGQIEYLAEFLPRQPYRIPVIFPTGNWIKYAFTGSASQWRKERLFPKTVLGQQLVIEGKTELGSVSVP